MNATHEERVLAAVESGWDAAHRIQRDRARLGEAAAELVGFIRSVKANGEAEPEACVYEFPLSAWEAERLFALADNVKAAYSS